MHFTASIEATDELCSDIGQDVNDYLEYLLNGGDLRRRRRLNNDGSNGLNFTKARIKWNEIQEMKEKFVINQQEEYDDGVDVEDEDNDINQFYFAIGIELGLLLILLVFLGVFMYLIKKKVVENINSNDTKHETFIVQ